jgi:hypothetical protein
MDLPGVEYIWIHLVELIEACKNKFVLWQAIVGSFVWANRIKNVLIFLWQSNQRYEYKAEYRDTNLLHLGVSYEA